MWQSTYFPRSPTLSYPHQICRVGWGPGPTHTLKSVQGFRLHEGSKSAVVLYLALCLPPNLWFTFFQMLLARLASRAYIVWQIFGPQWRWARVHCTPYCYATDSASSLSTHDLASSMLTDPSQHSKHQKERALFSWDLLQPAFSRTTWLSPPAIKLF